MFVVLIAVTVCLRAGVTVFVSTVCRCHDPSMLLLQVKIHYLSSDNSAIANIILKCQDIRKWSVKLPSLCLMTKLSHLYSKISDFVTHISCTSLYTIDHSEYPYNGPQNHFPKILDQVLSQVQIWGSLFWWSGLCHAAADLEGVWGRVSTCAPFCHKNIVQMCQVLEVSRWDIYVYAPLS